MVTTASPASASSHGFSTLDTAASTRISETNAAVLVATDMNAVTEVGAPW